MIKRCIGAVALATVGFFSTASASERVTIDLFYEVGESRFEAASVLLRSGSDYLQRNVIAEHDPGHEAFSRFLGDSRNFTALLAIERDGSLLFDSFNETSVIRGFDLSDRRYFRDLQDVSSSPGPVVFPSIVARQSGHLLVPIAMRVPEIENTRSRVVVTLLRPESLIPNVSICAFCGLVVLRNGETIASDKPMTDVNEAVTSRIEFDGEYGSKVVEIRGFNVRMHWRNSRTSGLTYVYYVGVPFRSRI